MNAAVERYLGDFSAAEAHLPGHGQPWLRELRRSALDRFAELGFPSRREEDWKYTSVEPIEKHTFARPVDEAPRLREADIAAFRFRDLTCHQLVFVDGRYSPALSQPGDGPDGVTIMPMRAALAEMPPGLEAHLERHAEPAGHAFTALNTAFMDDGAYVHLDKRRELDEPLHLLFVSTASADSVAAHPRVLVVAEAGSRATVVESYESLGTRASLHNVHTEIVLHTGACIDHLKLQRESAKAFHIATLQSRLGPESQLVSHSVSIGGRLVRNDINANLEGEGARCNLNGLFMAGGRQHVDFHTRVDHAEPAGFSRQYYKGVLSGRARGVFDGRVHVHPQAQKSDARQTNNNLLLSRDAEVDTKPQLEIYADDVQCSHGATVGQLDEQMLFYLRSRGIDAEAARALLVYGFARDVVDRIDLIAVRARLAEVILSRVPDAEHVREVIQ